MNVLHEDGILRLVADRDLLCGVWFDAPTLTQMAALERESHALHARYPRHAYANLIVRGVPRFTAEVRAAVEKLSRETDTWGIATAHIILAGGLTGSAVRAFLSTVMLITRPKTPTKVFGDTGTAAKWMSEHLATGSREPHSLADILSFFERIRV